MILRMATFLDRLRGAFRAGRDALTGNAPAPSPEAYFLRADVWTPVSSSNVKAVAYYSDVTKGGRGGILGVQFIDKGRGVSTYLYYAVPYSIYADMLSASSKGRFVWQSLRDRYQYKRIR
jgi:hypothetical protein